MIVILPDIVKRLRVSLPLSQAQLAENAGIARHTIMRIEMGRAKSVTFDTVNKLAEALGVDANQLVDFVERPAKRRSSERHLR